ncbi:uncharacterized protein LOC119575094 isoform X4 [Penaeus monodon]|uniref:uncharacterized protein LOC119575094 isoform X4 n=1 Tax=Penaeus monodon TaxID=6687 RepID=UPI0018A6EB47|nr:uncharacterized protein LOC119575094 isoform X4 [Penaeus monodon]
MLRISCFKRITFLREFGCPKGDTQPSCQDELIRNTSGKSVKSEVSSMTSGHTQGSGPSLSRDSLVVVTHASSGHQACLLSDRDSPSDYLFDCECCCDPPCPASCPCEYPDEEADDSEYTGLGFEDSRDSTEDLPRSLSMPLKEQAQMQKAGEENCEPNSNNNSVRAKTSPRPASNPVAFSPYDLTLPRPPKRALDTVSPLGRTREADPSVMDEAFRTRSLPAWVRNKTRPLTTLDDLNTIYEKPHWSKRRRNRMRSDAAAVIALSKSRGRLLSPSPQVTAQTSTSVAAQPDTAALVENEAVIVYDERTAL